MSDTESLQSDKLITKYKEIQENLEKITFEFINETEGQKIETATKLQSLYRGNKARQETEELKDCKTKFEELKNFDGEHGDFETKLDDLYKKCKSRIKKLNGKKIRNRYVENKCNKATTLEEMEKITYRGIPCKNVAKVQYDKLEEEERKKKNEEEKRAIEERLQKQRKAKAAKAAALSAREAEATKCQKKINDLVGIYDSIKKDDLDIHKDGENIYNMFQLIIEIYDSRTFDNLETPGENSVCTKTKLRKNKDQLETIIKLLKTIELFQDEKYVTDGNNTYEVIIKNSLQTNDMDKKIVYNVELKDIATKKTETIRLLDLKYDGNIYKEVNEEDLKNELEKVKNLREEEAAVKIQSIIRGRQQAQKARQAAIDKGAIDKVNDNIPIAKEEILETATEINNTELDKIKTELAKTKENLTEKIAEYKKHEELNNKEINKLKEEQKKVLKQQFAKQSEDYNKALAVAKEEAEKEKEELKKEKNEYEQQAENAAKAAKNSKQEIEELNQKIKNLQEEDTEEKAQLEKKKKEIEKEAEAAAAAKVEAEVKVSLLEKKKEEVKKEQIKIEQLKSQHEKELKELRNLEKKQKEREALERRKKMKEFMERKGESLKEAIESLKDDKGKFINMSEIKIDALENYPTLHDKIKKFLVFKEDELIKAHHAKFYSDNIKRNNEKLVETLKLVPSEPFLGIEGLPLMSGFGSEVKEGEEEVIILKDVKEKVRKFIQDRAQYIFIPSQHKQLSVKEYLKNL